MSQYHLLTNYKTVSAGPGPVVSVKPFGPTNPDMPAQLQSFQLNVSGVGPLSATAQIVVSNDGTNWMPYLGAVTAAGNGSVASAGVQGNGSWRYFGSYLTAISGTNAVADLVMSA